MLKKHANKSSEFFEISLFVELLWKNPCIISRLEIGFELASNWLCIGFELAPGPFKNAHSETSMCIYDRLILGLECVCTPGPLKNAHSQCS